MQRVTILINRKKYISVSDRGGGGKSGIATGGWVVSEKPLGRVSITQIRSFCTLIDFRCRVSSDFSDLFTKLYFHSSKLVDEYVGQKFKLLSRQKLHATRVKIVRVNVRFSFSSFNEANISTVKYIRLDGTVLSRRGKKRFRRFRRFITAITVIVSDPLAHESSSLNSV